MEKKTEEKLERRFLTLPLHHIDTSIILETPTTESGRACRKYLQVLNTKYRGKFSLPVLGELLLRILKLETVHEKYVTLDIITEWIKNKRIELYIPTNISETVNTIKTIDTRIKETDAHILACAIEDNALTFVTLDKELTHNHRIEENFDINIVYPDELV